MSSSSPEMDWVTHAAVAAAVTAAQMTAKDAGASNMNAEDAFQAGKSIGLHLSKVAMGSDYLLSLRDYLKKSEKMQEEMQELRRDVERQSFEVDKATSENFAEKCADVTISCWEFLAELEIRYGEEIKESSVEMLAICQK